MSLTNHLKTIHFTEIEFGALSTIYEELQKAKTKKEHNKLIHAITSYLKSLTKVKILTNMPDTFEIYSIRKEVMGSFPSYVGYDITIFYPMKEDNGK